MSRIDQITGKKAMRGNTRSFAMNHSPRRWELNLQKCFFHTRRGKNFKDVEKTKKSY